MKVSLIPLGHGEALNIGQEHNCFHEYPRLIRRRARQRARRKLFRNGFQEMDVALRAKVAQLESDNQLFHGVKDDLTALCDRIKGEMEEVTRRLHEESWQRSEMARQIADQERAVVRRAEVPA